MGDDFGNVGDDDFAIQVIDDPKPVDSWAVGSSTTSGSTTSSPSDDDGGPAGPSMGASPYGSRGTPPNGYSSHSDPPAMPQTSSDDPDGGSTDSSPSSDLDYSVVHTDDEDTNLYRSDVHWDKVKNRVGLPRRASRASLPLFS